VTRSEREVGHLALDATGIAAIAAGHNALLKDLVEVELIWSTIRRTYTHDGADFR
jgi:hypothetical protein